MESFPPAKNNCSLWGTVRLAFRKHLCKKAQSNLILLVQFLKQTASRFEGNCWDMSNFDITELIQKKHVLHNIEHSLPTILNTFFIT